MAFSVQYNFRVLDRFSRPVAAMRQKTLALKRVLDKMAKSSMALNSVMTETVNKIKALSPSMHALRSDVERLSVAAKKSAKSIDHIANSSHRAGEAASFAAAKIGRTSNAYVTAGNRMKAFGDKAMGMQNVLASVGIVIAAKRIVVGSISIEDALSDVSRVSGMAGKVLAKFRVGLELMAEKLGKPAEGLAKIAFEGGRLGIAKKYLLSFTRQVVKMAVAFDMTEEAAGASMGSIKAKLGLTMVQVEKLADTMNFLADNTAASGERMIEIVARTAGSMKTLRVPPEAAAGLAAFADQIEVSAELAASGLNMTLSRMMKMPGMMEKLLNDPAKTIRETFANLAKIPEAKRAIVIFKQFGENAGRFVLKATSSMKLFDSTIATAFSTGAVGSMDREMQNRAGRTSTIFARAVEMMRNSLARFGDAMKPTAISIAFFFINVLKVAKAFAIAHPRMVKFAGIAALIAGAVMSATVVLGIMSSALGGILTLAPAISAAFAGFIPALASLIPVIASLALPITAVVAGVGYVVAAFRSWVQSGHPVIQSMKDIYSQVSFIVSEIGGLFRVMFEASGMSGIFSGAMDIVTDSFSKFGHIVRIGLVPVKLSLELLRAMVDIFTDLITFNFEGAFSGLFKSMQNIVNIVFEAVDSIKNLLNLGAKVSNIIDKAKAGATGALSGAYESAKGVLFGQSAPGQAQATVQQDLKSINEGKANAPTQNVNVGGEIRVSAEKGSKITHAQPDLNMGGNVAFAN